MPTPIKDRFDDIPADLHRVGAHRAPRRRGQRWIAFGWAALATVLLVVAGLWGLSLLNPDLEIRPPGGSAGQPPTDGEELPGEVVEPRIDPALPITVLNGTPTAGFANEVGDFLEARGWDGAAVGAGGRAAASSSEVQTTQIVYSDPANEAAARMLQQQLGVGELVLSNDYPMSPMTVLIGADLEIPAA